ncbi:hypothetical protein JTB14_038008 [Gonioctena quinquepunctata]|nr:hypothetical protein JTB14_038008 [Gonioctena quinquepunctata]
MALNKPSQVPQNVKPFLTFGNPADGSVFVSEVSVRETVSRLTFTPSTPALIEISRKTYAEMLTDDPQLGKTLLHKYHDNYTTALLWLRIINLKQKNSQPLSDEENDLLVATQTTAFSVPEPLALQYRQLGAVRASISDAAPGVYQLALSQGDSTMNRNLLGYRPHAVRRAEAKNLAFSNEITAAEFSDYPANTGFNFLAGNFQRF